MKTFISHSMLCIVLLVLGQVSVSQTARPDTIYWGDPCYMYCFDSLASIEAQLREDSVHGSIDSVLDRSQYKQFFLCDNNYVRQDNNSHGYLAQVEGHEYTLNSTERYIHGVAVAMSTDIQQYMVGNPMAHRIPPCAYLFQKENGVWRVVDSVGFSEYIPHRYLSSVAYYFGQPDTETVPVYAFYFATPHLVHDTFAVGYGLDDGGWNRTMYDNNCYRFFLQSIQSSGVEVKPFFYRGHSSLLPQSFSYRTYALYIQESLDNNHRPVLYNFVNRNRHRFERMRPSFFDSNNVLSYIYDTTYLFEIYNSDNIFVPGPYHLPLIFPILDSAPIDYVYLPVEKDTTPIIIPPCRADTRDFRVGYIMDNDVQLQWNAVNDTLPDYWQLELRIEGEDTVLLFNTSREDRHLSMLDSGRYVARVRAVCLHSCDIHGDTMSYGAWSNEVSFYIEQSLPTLPPLGVEEEGISVVGVAPNPADDFVDITVEGNLRSVTLRNLKGEILLQQPGDGSQTLRIDTSLLPRGLYIVEVDTVQGRFIRKLVLQ